MRPKDAYVKLEFGEEPVDVSQGAEEWCECLGEEGSPSFLVEMLCRFVLVEYLVEAIEQDFVNQAGFRSRDIDPAWTSFLRYSLPSVPSSWSIALST